MSVNAREEIEEKKVHSHFTSFITVNATGKTSMSGSRRL